METQNLLLEIGTEEMPPSVLAPAVRELEGLLKKGLQEADLGYASSITGATPRRLSIYLENIPLKQPDKRLHIIGPPAPVAFDKNGRPTKAAEGFARKNGLDVSELRIEETDRGPYVVADKHQPGSPTLTVLARLIPETIKNISFPKTMKWEGSGFRFVRPIRWLLVLFGMDVVPVRIAGVESSNLSYGHRFMSQGSIQFDSADFEAYVASLLEAYVVVDLEERKSRVLESCSKAAKDCCGNLVEDMELVDINSNLTEYPTAVCGKFDRDFLRLPRPVLVTCMREHQKYFAVDDGKGKLLPHFIAVNNTLSPKPELITKGHERVLRARLSDAAFFFEEDTKKRLEEFVPELQGVTFQRGLGSLFDKAKRIEALAVHLSQILCPDKQTEAARAAILAKADLVTEMVGEFPTLQGTMGKEYALLSGEKQEVAVAIEEHYMPLRSGGKVPETILGTVIALADKIDTICAIFAIGERPTGTADPYGLRRHALGILHILEEKALDLSLKALIAEAVLQLESQLKETFSNLETNVLDFLKNRFVNDQIFKGRDADAVEAVVDTGFDRVPDSIKRIEALMEIRKKADFEDLSLAFKRVMNILKDFDGGSIRPELLKEKAEKDLFDQYTTIEADVRRLIKEQKYTEALETLLNLKPYIDTFFDNVLVMVDDKDLRNNRLGLLHVIAKLFLEVGNLSKMAPAS